MYIKLVKLVPFKVYLKISNTKTERMIDRGKEREREIERERERVRE